MNNLERVKSLLQEHRGKENAITSREISEELGGLDSLDSTPRTREIIRRLVRERGVPVAATSSGYFLIENQDELNEYITNLTIRAREIEERKEAVLRAVEGYDMPVQKGLTTFEPAD